MGFLRQRKDGTTSLAILTPCDSGTVPGTTEVPVTLGTPFYLEFLKSRVRKQFTVRY